MRSVALAVVVTIFVAGVPGVANAACNGTLATKTGPTGITLQVCLMEGTQLVSETASAWVGPLSPRSATATTSELKGVSSKLLDAKAQ
jgi:hypothetical protein